LPNDQPRSYPRGPVRSSAGRAGAQGVEPAPQTLERRSAGDAASAYQSSTGQEAKHETGKPTIWRLSFDIYLYTNTPEPAVPASTMNPILDAVCAALAPTAVEGTRCTLGGLVHDCRISGKVETDEGTLGAQSVSIIPVEVVAVD